MKLNPKWSSRNPPLLSALLGLSAQLDASMRFRYAVHMRTTISLEDRLAQQVRRKAEEEGLSVSAFIARTLDDALKRMAPQTSPPFRLVTVKGDGLHPGIELDRPRALVAEDDEAIFARQPRKR